ncbi:MAG: DoxX family protein [Actinomycetota bacterium]|nr:DoxX family protein [Actinomycetota bacterium]
MSLVRTLARPMLASMFVAGGVNEIRNAVAMAPTAHPVTHKVAPVIASRVAPAIPLPSDTAGWVRVDGAIKVLAGLALATGRFPRLSALTLAASLAPTTVAAHAFWKETENDAKAAQQIQFFKNVSMMGGLMIAAVDLEPSARERVEISARRVKRKLESD